MAAPNAGTSGAGRRWPAEWTTYPDPVTGVPVQQLTNYLGHSYHPYFTESGWYDGGNKYVFTSDRENRTNVFGLDLTSGEITQLTDLDPAQGRIGNLSKNPAREEAYFYQGNRLYALDLHTYDLRHLYTRPDGYVRDGRSVTADGRYVCTFHVEDPTLRLGAQLGNKVNKMREYLGGHKSSGAGELREMTWRLRPRSMIVKVPTDQTGTTVGHGAEIAFEEHEFMGHVNCSPTQPNLLTFCHEGPWNLVQQRIWALDLNTGQPWAIRPQQPGEAIGHEYWMVDGVHLGYHGRTPGGPIYGSIRYDNTEQTEAPLTYGSTHFHSSRLDLIVGDGSRNDPFLLLWRYRDGRFEGPKALVWHQATMHMGYLHVHPCFSPYGNQIIYTSDPEGYGQIFQINVPDFDTLPDRSQIAHDMRG